MPRYQLYVIRGVALEGGLDSEFPDDQTALSAAQSVALPGEELEVWCGMRWIGLIEDGAERHEAGDLRWPKNGLWDGSSPPPRGAA